MSIICDVCNKTYSSKKVLSQHKRTIHNIYCIGIDRRKDEVSNKYGCKYCKKQYPFSQSRWRHEKTCVVKIENEKNEEYRKQLEELVKNLQKEIDEKNKIINDKDKCHTNEIIGMYKKMNDIHERNSNTVNCMMSTINAILTNINMNNIENNKKLTNSYLVEIGNENALYRLTNGEKKTIINTKKKALEEFVKVLVCGNIDICKNIIITNLNSKDAFTYNEKMCIFIPVNKDELLYKLINYRIADLKDMVDELEDKELINKFKKSEFIKHYDKILDENSEHYALEKDALNKLLYSTQHIVKKYVSNLEYIISKTPKDNINEIIELETQKFYDEYDGIAELNQCVEDLEQYTN